MKFDPSSAVPEQEFDPTTAVPEEAPPVRAVLQTAVKQKPDQVARATTLGKQYGMPTDVVVRNLQNVELQAAVDAADARLQTSPKLAAAMRKRPEIAALAHDDLGSLTELEAATRKYGEWKAWNGPEPTLKNIALGLAKAVPQAGSAIKAGLDAQMTDFLEWVGLVTLDPITKADRARKLAQASGAADFTRPDFESSTGRAIYGGVESTLRMIPGLAASILTRSPTPMLAAAGVQSEAEAYGKYRTRGASGGQALVGALGEGAVEVATELLPAGFLTSRLGKAGVGEFVTGLLAREIPGEQIATLLQDAIDTAVANPDKTWGEYLSERPQAAYETLVSTLTQSALMSGVHGAARRLAQMGDQGQQADESSTALGDALKRAGASALRERSPEQFHALMGEMTDGKVYVDGEVLNQLPEDVKAALPQAVQDQIATAAATGDVVEIPVADVLTVAPGTALEEVLVEHARTDPFAMSKADATEATKLAQSSVLGEAQRLIQQAEDADARQAEYDQIHKIYVEQLNAAARFRPAVNEAKAHWLASFYTTMAARTGMTPAEFQAAHPVRILGEASTAGQTVMGQTKAGEITVEGYHFSKEDRPTITTAAYGTGLQGSGREMFLNAEDQRLRKRSYFYADKGTGIRPESGVGGRAHRVQLTNVYDSNRDPLGLKKGGGGQLGFESRVLDAGFSGYLDRLEGTQPGQVIMLGDQTFRPELLGPQSQIETGKRVPAMPQTEPQWTNYATGDEASLQAQMERLQAKSSWGAYDMRVADGALQYRKKQVLEQRGEQKPGKPVPPAVDAVANVQAAFELANGQQFKTNRDLKLALQERVLEALKAAKINLDDFNAGAEQYLVRVALTDAQIALETNPNAVGWYNEKVTKALRLVALIHPEIQTDPQAKFAFVWAMAVTSNGLKVDKNFELAEQAYSTFKATGKMPTDIQAGQAQAAINNGLALFNEMLTKHGFEALQSFMTTKATVKEIQAFSGLEVGGENLTTEVYGSAILGPKIGNGFFSNLYGRFEQLTMDRWLMRTWGRWTGTLIETNPEQVRAKRVQMRSLIQGLDKDQKKAFEAIIKRKLTVGDADAVALAIWKASQKPINRARMAEVGDATDAAGQARLAAVMGPLKKGQKRISFGDELRKVGNALTKYNDGQKEAPSGPPERGRIRKVFGQALARLQERYPALTMSDLQALLWYPEKRLYDAAKEAGEGETGYEDDAAPDYANAAAKLAREKGVSDEDIARTIEEVDNELRATDRAAGAGRDPVAVAEAPAAETPARGVPDAAGVRGGAGLLEQQAGDLTDGQAGNRGGRYSSGSLAPLEGAPAVAGAAGPDARLVAVAERYAAEHGIPLRRQAAYVQVDPERAARIAAAYEAMAHAPNDPAVREAYDNLAQQTLAQYLALQAAGYQFYLVDETNDPYAGNPWNAMRDLRANQTMGVFATEAGFGSGAGGMVTPENAERAVQRAGIDLMTADGIAEYNRTRNEGAAPAPEVVIPDWESDSSGMLSRPAYTAYTADGELRWLRFADWEGRGVGLLAEDADGREVGFYPADAGPDVSDNPLLADTGIEWGYGSVDGPKKRVLFNDLFRAVHDAFGHGLEGAGFRAQGEENAWQAHVRLFTGSAVGAITSETRGQNSWLNYGPHGHANQTAKVEDTIFADQKTGLMPSWTWTEGRVGDEQQVLEQQGLTSQRKKALVDAARRVGQGLDLIAYDASISDDKMDQLANASADMLSAVSDFEMGALSLDDIEAEIGHALRLLNSVSQGKLDSNVAKTHWFTAISTAAEALGSVAVWRDTFGQEPQQPRGTFNPATLELVLNPNANLSTFFHETGHFFLEVLADIASQPNAPAQIVSDFATFLKWAGVADAATWNAMTLDQKRGAHERWAESIEQYVMEGKAPSVELQPLMRRFAAWLKSVYGSIKQFLAARGQAPAAGGEALNQVPAPDGALTDKNGRPLVLYHGTRRGGFATFNAESHFGSAGAANKRLRMLGGDNGSVYPVYLTVKNPKRVADRGKNGKPTEWNWAVDTAKAEGYDSLVYTNDVEGGGDSYVVFDPKQIVSAISGEVLGQNPAARSDPPMALNDDIRRVMDRLLATDEQIAQANEVAGLVPDEAADAAAAERLAKRSIADLKWSVRARDQVIAKLQREARAIEKDIREQVTVEVDQTPEMRAKAALDALRVDPEHDGAMAAHKAARKAAQEQARAEVKAVLLADNPDAKGLQKGQLLAKNKRDIDNKVDAAMIRWDAQNPEPRRQYAADDADVATIADSFGFESVDAMLQAIDAFGSRRDAIDGMTQQRMLEEHGDLIDDRAIAEAANEAVHNEARARSLATELRTQREMLNVRAAKPAAPPLPDTKAVDADGAPMLVYHGTDKQFDAFDGGMFTSTRGRAENYAMGSKGRVLEVYLNITNPMPWGDAFGKSPEEIKAAGYDGTIQFGGDGSIMRAVVVDASQVVQPLQATNAKGSKVTVNALVEAAKQFGANVVARTPLRDLKNRVWQHTAAERRAAKRWQDATAAGKTEEAVKAKQDQMLNHAAAKAAIDARAEAKKILEFFRRVTKGNDEKVVEKGRDADIVNAARAVLAAYGVQSPTTKTAEAYLETLQTADPETYNVIAPMVEGATRNAQPLDALTVDELKALEEEIQAMWFLAKRSRQMEVAGDLMDIEDAADEIYTRLEDIGIPDVIPGELGAVTQKEERARWLQFARALLRRVEQWAEGMDGKYGGPLLRFVFQPVSDAANRYRADRIEYRKKFQALVDAVAPSFTHQLIQAPELSYTFGKGHNGIGHAELLHALLHTGNESNKRKLLLGRGWATDNGDGTIDTGRWDAFIKRMADTGVLTPAHYDFAQGVWDLLEQTKPLAQATHRAVFGRYFAEVTADSFADPWGQARRGGYVPAQADPAIVADADLRALAERENENMAFAFPATSKGFTKSRVEYNRPLKLDLRTIPQHLDKVLLFSHMEPAVRGVAKLLRQKKVAQPMARIDPAAYSGMLLPWLNRSARQQVETPILGDGRTSRVLSALRSRAGAALMFANLSNTVQQLTGFLTARVKVKGSHLLSAAAAMVAHPKQTRAAVANASTYMANRMENEVAAMNDAMNEILLDPSLYERSQAWAVRHSYFLQSALDNAMSPIIWTGAYNQALEQKMTHEDAVRFADGVIRQTQGDNTAEGVSRIETGPAYGRMFTQFIGYFNMLANTNGTALQQIANEMGLKKGAGKALGVVFYGMLAPIWVAEAIAQAFRGGPDDEDKDGQYLDDWLAAVFGMGTIKGLLAQVPFVNMLGQGVLNRFNTNPADDKFSLSPAVSLLESAVNAPFSVYKAIADEGNRQKAVRDTAALISMATGLPAVAVARPLGYLAGVEQGKVDPTGPVDAARGLVTGTASPESKQR